VLSHNKISNSSIDYLLERYFRGQKDRATRFSRQAKSGLSSLKLKSLNLSHNLLRSSDPLLEAEEHQEDGEMFSKRQALEKLREMERTRDNDLIALMCNPE